MPYKSSLVLCSCSTPMLYGIYEDNKLIQSWSFEGKTLDGLVNVAKHCRGVDRVFYARGPGSFTAIKLTHIFLQTLQITQGIELFSTDSFYFNDNAPIKAFGNQYFIKRAGDVVLCKYECELEKSFKLPQKLQVEDFSSSNEPLYILPPI